MSRIKPSASTAVSHLTLLPDVFFCGISEPCKPVPQRTGQSEILIPRLDRSERDGQHHDILLIDDRQRGNPGAVTGSRGIGARGLARANIQICTNKKAVRAGSE